MNGWIALGFLLALSGLALWTAGIRGAFLQMAGAALLVGAAGYVVQGQPSLAGAPSRLSDSTPPLPLARLRYAFYGQFTPAETWLKMSESFAGRGETEDAAGIMRSAVREHPTDPELWVGLGNALVDHAGTVTPASMLAYQRAEELAPGHPGAPFFLGLALARSGDRDGALAQWRRILAGAPADASWRPLVEDAVLALSPATSPPAAPSGKADAGG